jgi:hypothetical protein
MTKDGHLSIWVFVGVLLTIYGVLIVGAGLYGLSNPPDVKLARLHADLWWGGLLLVLGLVYVAVYNPARSMARARDAEVRGPV